jgi:hypothetical chaperone protein
VTSFGRDKPIAYGIDFGTSNSTVAVAYRDRVEPLPIEAGSTTPSVVPSIIYLHRDRNRVAGQQAVRQFTLTGSQRTRCGNCSLVRVFNGVADTSCRQYRSGAECQDARIISGVKSFLADTAFTRTHSWGMDFTLDDLVAVVLRRLKTSADRTTGADVKRVVLGHPVSFVGAEGPDYNEQQQTALARLENAARIAGFTEVELLEEPAAALNSELMEDGIVLAADFGGGTFDVAVTKFAPDGGDVLALTGAEIGGEDFDKRLFQAKVGPLLHLTDQYQIGAGQSGRQLPPRILKHLAGLSGLNFLLSDRETLATLNRYRNAPGGDRLSAVRSILYGGHAYEFYRAIEEAKIRLSTQHSASIEFHRPGIDISVPVERVEFEVMIADLLQVVRRAIIRALSDSGIGPESVSMVLLTGGSSSIPAFVRILEEFFDPSIIQQRPVYTTVAEGLARQALELWS